MDDDQYDVFLCHNSQDKPVVRELGELLKQRGLKVWLDEWELIPGDRWLQVIQNLIANKKILSAAVLVGLDGFGPWHKQEVEGFLIWSINHGLRVIPVLLPNSPSDLELPPFLASLTWVDLREGLSQKNLDRLVWGITGVKPEEQTVAQPSDKQVAMVAAQMGVTGVVPSELYLNLAAKLGVTEAALGNFFEIMEEQQVPPEKLDCTLRDIAGRYKDLQAKLAQTNSDDSEVIALKEQAKQALDEGDFDQAENLLNQASDSALNVAKMAQERIKKDQEIVDKQFLSAAASKAEAGDLKMTQLAYAAAADYYGRAAELVPVGSELDKAGYMNQQGSALYLAGKYAEAEAPLKDALDIRDQLLEPNYPKIADSLNDLAALYQAQGKYAQAEPLFQRALEIREEVLAPDHPDTATTLNNLAGLYSAEGKYDQAEPLYQRSLNIYAQALGPDHPDTATTLNNLAELYQAQGKYDEAEPLYLRALKIREDALGPDHPD
ncbi:MAG: toll/interleukin-1 receptor domain-containing protein, partial [Deltaproteobacteria bacterium]|nr:toll/interleukin-1 receptor domain-containing protein [Deltaproteobacteria bacterium]